MFLSVYDDSFVIVLRMNCIIVILCIHNLFSGLAKEILTSMSFPKEPFISVAANNVIMADNLINYKM